MDYAAIRGFNYQPSYGTNGFELWRQFDAPTVDLELGRGRQYFPKMNAIRLWLSWDAFLRHPARFADNFDTALALADKHGLVVMPVLFNRWHASDLDYGGIYIDHFLPRVSWVQKPGWLDPYIEAIVGSHADDPRVFAWDLCNEPFSYLCPITQVPDIAKAELDWLTNVHAGCKRVGAKAPITIGTHMGMPLDLVEPISDVLSIHPYWAYGQDRAAFESMLDGNVAFAAKVGKALLATETCWGSLDDAQRVEVIRYTLAQLRQRQIGWLAYLLHHSLIADAHRPQLGPGIADPGNLAFIEADGSLRPGHDVFNEFV